MSLKTAPGRSDAHEPVESEGGGLRLAARRAHLTDDSPASAVFQAATAARPLLIIVPLYRRPDLARSVVESLIDCAEEIRSLSAEVVLYNDSPKDALLGSTLEELTQRAFDLFNCRLEHNEENLGFVRTVNFGLAEAAERGMDALILNSDTVVFPGSLREMVRVSRLDPMTGFVNPRSNNATLATLPFQDRFRNLAPRDAYAAWNQVQTYLPEVSYVPTAIGFCMLIRWIVLAEFGVFDEIYGTGYNEENDLVMRAGRRGYRAILANRAFVWHEGGGSFRLGEETNSRDLKNRAKLSARYPEFWEFVQDHFRSPAMLAERLLGALVPNPDGRLSVALDFSHFAAAHNGTFVAGRQLLAVAVEAWSDRFEVCVICPEDAYAFHDLHATGAERRDPENPGLFAAIFRVGQPFHYSTLERLVRHAPVFGVFMLDTISLDCSQLAEARTSLVWGFTAEHADLIVATSELTAAQIERRLDFGPDVLVKRSLHSMDIADYRLEADPEPPIESGYVLVVGNHYWHKDVANTVNALAKADRARRIVAITGAEEAKSSDEIPPVDEGRYAPRGFVAAPNVIRMPAGEMSHGEIGALYANAQAVVFPSHYEGFGMPVLNALAVQRPVFVRPLPVFEELNRVLGGEPNLHVYLTTEDLVSRLAAPVRWRPRTMPQDLAGDALRAAQDIGQALDEAIGRASYDRIVRRIRALQFAQDYARATSPDGRRSDWIADGAPPPVPVIVYEAPPPATPKAFVANAIGRATERLATAVLRVPGVFAVMRLAVRCARVVGLASRPTEA